ncbi:MAG: tetratricopeptide repeat protein [Paludibacteraceae bacterium]|nr:tetratricopeptide repeat protein [Paludibacteraceae bacterium]
MKRYVSILLFLAMTCLAGYGQSARQADDLFNAREYAKARTIYDALLRKQPAHPLYLYRAARCAQETGDLTAAEDLFIKAGTKYPLRNFFLGELYFGQWRMPEALAAYEAVLPSIDEQNERYPIVMKHMAEAQVIARYLKHVSRIEVLGVQRVAKSDMLGAYTLSEECGILRLDSLGSSFTTQRGDRRYFSVRDSGRTMLVSQQRLLQDWEEPDTLRATINSGNTTNYPFVLTDGATLYFASDREGGLGGLDIYMTRYNAALGEWLPAENIGMPYNSPADDYLYVADEHANTAYFATNRHCTGTDSVEVYQVVLSERTFLKGLAHDELVALARLDSLITPTLPDIVTPAPAAPVMPTVPTAPKTAHDGDSIFFVLNDSHIYTSLDDFRSDTARVLYEQYMRMQQTQQQAMEMLDSLRQQYYQANDATRASLKARIPILSGEIDKRKRTLHDTLSQIRSLEAQH